jgi:hypothetical protein
VLPLRRYCPRFLSFPALVAGCLSPDLGYFFSGTGIDELAHTLLGSIIFGLPVGLLLLAAFYGLVLIAAGRLPVDYRRALAPMNLLSVSSLLIAVLSILIGTWTHLLWDAFTHTHGWGVLHVPVLNSIIAHFGDRKVRVCHLLWYGSSFAGVACVYVAFWRWQERQTTGAVAKSWLSLGLEGALVACLLVPIELAHHLVHGKRGLVLVAALSLAFVAVIVIRSHRLAFPPPG